MTYKDYEKEYNKLKETIADKEDDCAKRGLPFEEMLKETNKERNRLFELSQEMRLIQEPSLEFGKEWKGDTMTINKFKKLCVDGSLTDNDGYGYYATAKAKSNVVIYPSDITENKYRSDFSHIIWFNK